MRKMNNFKTALDEILSLKPQGEAEGGTDTRTVEAMATANTAAKPEFADSNFADIIKGISNSAATEDSKFSQEFAPNEAVKPTPVATPAPAPAPVAPVAPVRKDPPQPYNNVKKDAPVSTIYEDVIIDGNIKSLSHLKIMGVINGNVESDGDVMLNGTVTGSIACQNITLANCTVTGDIAASGNVSIHSETVLNSNIVAKNLNSSGKVKGNLQIDGKLELAPCAIQVGNISARSISIQDGAVIKGTVEVLGTD